MDDEHVDAVAHAPVHPLLAAVRRRGVRLERRDAQPGVAEHALESGRDVPRLAGGLLVALYLGFFVGGYL